MTGRAEVLAAFDEAASWLAAAAAGVPADAWDRPGLGEWTVRQLVGHAARALVTVEEYLTEPGDGETADDDDPLGAAGRYYLGTRDNPRLHAEVAERGRQAAAELGDDPAAAVAELAGRVRAALAGAGPHAYFASRFGPVGFRTYLCTRATECVVHTVDVHAALGTPAEPPPAARRLVLGVLGEAAAARGQAAAVVAALTGRAGLPPGFSVVG